MSHTPDNPINHGVLDGRRPTDFVAGVLPYEVRNITGSWDAYLPSGEKQYNTFADSQACVTFSLLNAIETQEKFLTGVEPNYSDRWTALMSGTTKQGNYLYKVADTVRQYGLVKESSWPTPATFTWESYYEQPSPEKQAELLAEGQEWLRTHTLQYEWLTTNLDDIEKHLKQCPLQLVIPGHAIEGFKEVGDTSHYFDTYEPYKKTIWRGALTDVLKPLLTIKNMSQFKTQNYKGELRIVLSASDIEQWKAICAVFGIDPNTISETVL